MDELLPPAFYDMISISLSMFGLVVVVVIANYYIIVPTLVVFFLLYLIRVVYINTVRDVKRWESISKNENCCRDQLQLLIHSYFLHLPGKSPVFSHMITSFQGLSIIRSSNSQEIVVQKFDGLQVGEVISGLLRFPFMHSSRFTILCSTYLYI
jgi:hypothetical protein